MHKSAGGVAEVSTFSVLSSHVTDEWGGRLIGVAAREIRRHRARRGLSAQQLADACSKYGLSMKRSVIANLESGRRPTLSLVELIVLAKVLQVAPVELVLPLGYESEIEILPGEVVNTWDAAKWFMGEEPFTVRDEDGQPHVREDDLREWNRSVHPVVLYRHHDELISAWRSAREDLYRMQQTPDGSPPTEMQLEAIGLREYRVKTIEWDLHGLRHHMRAGDLITPDLPPEAQHVDDLTEDPRRAIRPPITGYRKESR